MGKCENQMTFIRAKLCLVDDVSEQTQNNRLSVADVADKLTNTYSYNIGA